MQRFRLRAAAVLIGLFLPALGVCASLTPPAAFLAYCSAGACGERSCCEVEADASCPAPARAPESPRCRACEGLLTFAGEERPALRVPAAAAPLPASVAAARPLPILFSPNRLGILTASPPLQLLHESLRN